MYWLQQWLTHNKGSDFSITFGETMSGPGYLFLFKSGGKQAIFFGKSVDGGFKYLEKNIGDFENWNWVPDEENESEAERIHLDDDLD